MCVGWGVGGCRGGRRFLLHLSLSLSFVLFVVDVAKDQEQENICTAAFIMLIFVAASVIGNNTATGIAP